MKFINLFRKELSELLNKQMLIGLVIMMLILMFIGGVMKTTLDSVNDIEENYSMNICDSDDTEFTRRVIAAAKKTDSEVNVVSGVTEKNCAKFLADNGLENVIIIPEGFTEKLRAGEKPELISISAMRSLSALNNISNSSSGALYLLQEIISSAIASEKGLTGDDLALINESFTTSERTVVNGRSAEVSVGTIVNKLTVQNMILPIVVFVLIMLTSQMLISAISNEKIDKTLETLLSTPVSRTSIILAKMLAVATVALINAAAYMLGFSFFIASATSSVTENVGSSDIGGALSTELAMSQLGLSLSLVDYILIGIQLFFTILICLSISLILGAMANDSKSSQNMITPIIFLAMVPYLISMVSDLNSLPIVLRIIVYAIPFSHTFSAASNLMLGNYAVFFGGLIYQTVVFTVCMFAALRLFRSDKIFTISLNFGQKRKYKKNASKAE